MARSLPIEILTQARHLIADRARWTRFAPARDPQGRRCSAIEPDAVRYCAYGALLKCAKDLVADKARAKELAQAAESVLSPKERISSINDRKGHRSVLTHFDQALARHRFPLFGRLQAGAAVEIQVTDPPGTVLPARRLAPWQLANLPYAPSRSMFDRSRGRGI